MLTLAGGVVLAFLGIAALCAISPMVEPLLKGFREAMRGFKEGLHKP